MIRPNFNKNRVALTEVVLVSVLSPTLNRVFFFALVFSKATTQKKKANSDRVPYLQPATLLKKRSWHRYFSVNFTILLETAFYGIPTCDCFLLFRSCTLSKCYNQDIKMTTTEAILLALLLTLKMFFSAVI